MAANMQHMAGAGQMMPQQMRKPTNNQLQQAVYQNIQQNTPPLNGMTWQSNSSINERMGKTLELISNITLAMSNLDYSRATEFGCQFEREMFHKSPTKEAYDQAMANKTLDFFQKRQANEPGLQNSLNANAQAQAHAQAQAQAQAQALMLQAQMGRGQTPQGFQHMSHPMQAAQMPQQQQQQQPSLFQQQQQIAMGMANQAGRGIGPNSQAMGMAGGPNRNMMPNEVARLAQADKSKVMDLATKMMSQATEQQKAQTRLHLQSRLTAQQLAELQTQGRDPLIWWYQNQAFLALKQSSSNMNRFQPPGPTNPNNPQAAMMQQQQSQNSLQQQRQNMINAAQPPGAGHDFPPFNPSMESIKDQQVAGLMAQKAGQVVVPASNVNGRNVTPQPGNQNIPNQQMQGQTPRTAQQQQQQQQAKLNQAAQQSQALQAQAQMQMQNQQQMTGNMATSQSPAMNTLNTPVSRPVGMNPMTPQGMGQNSIPFGDSRFHQGIQRPNNPAFNAMLANMTPEQRQAVNGLPPEKLNEVMIRWQNQRREQMANMNANPMMQQQMANRPPNQFNQNGNIAPGLQNMQQMNAPGPGNQQQSMPLNRIPAQNGQLQFLMDSMDLPPTILTQIQGLPAEVKKWRDLKAWINQNNTLQPSIRGQLAAFQQKQFQVLMHRRAVNAPPQSGQGLNMNPAMSMPMTNQQPGMQRQMAGMPPQLLQVSPQELMHIRSSKPALAGVPDEQLRGMILAMKKNSWTQQQTQQQLRIQQMQAQSQQMQNATASNMAGTQGPQNAMQIQQSQPNLTPQQTQSQTMPSAMSQTASMQAVNQKQQPNANQARNNQSQPAKTLKRSNPDDGADTVNMKASLSAARQPPAPTMTATTATTSQPTQPPGQRPGAKFPPQLTAQQEAQLKPEQRARYEQLLRMQGKAPGPPSESLMRLKMIGQEEQKQFAQESTPDIPMSPEEYAETAAKLKRIVVDMGKVGRGLSKWYSLTQDDARAKMFFRTRLRLIKQHVDGDKMEVVKDAFSIRSSELDQARAMLESMAKDLAASVAGGRHIKPGGQAQSQSQPLPQQQTQQAQQKNLTQPAPLNAANLEKNAQAMNKLSQQKQANKAGQVPPPAPTSAQPPFPFGAATSPDGHPTYMSKPKEINLQLPPSRKKQKLANSGPSSQVATPSPQISKNASPDIQRPQGPPKPVHLCTEPDCDQAIFGFPTKQALQHHIDEEHTKPRADPVKFVQENLAEALGLEPDGTFKKEQKLAEGAQAMSLSASKQGQSSGNLVGTPMSMDGTGMKRSASVASKAQDVKAGIKLDATAKVGDGKQMNGAAMLVTSTDPWANSTIDPQTLLQHLGFENGLPNIINEANMYRSFTPKDTPESSKDGASEPNSDISEGAALDIDMNWGTLDNEALMDFTNACINGEMDSTENLKAALVNVDPTLLLARSRGVPDWDTVQPDFDKPFEMDLGNGLYSLGL